MMNQLTTAKLIVVLKSFQQKDYGNATSSKK